MLQFENQKIKHIVRKALPVVVLVAMLYSCASIGRPEGGPKDYDPPRFIGSTPAAIMGALEPVTAVIIGVCIFGESFSFQLAIGILAILAGVTIIIARKK